MEQLSESLTLSPSGVLLFDYKQVFGVGETLWPEQRLVWTLSRGAPKQVDEGWLATEDGQQFQEEMDDFFEKGELGFGVCRICGGPAEGSDGLCYNCRHGITY